MSYKSCSVNNFLTVVGCHCRHFNIITVALISIRFKGNHPGGTFYCDWLLPVSNDVKVYCLSFNLTKIIDSPNDHNHKYPEKSSVIDLFINNVLHKYSVIGVFANNFSDYSVVSGVRDAKLSHFRLLSPTVCMKSYAQIFVHNPTNNHQHERPEVRADVPFIHRGK